MPTIHFDGTITTVPDGFTIDDLLQTVTESFDRSYQAVTIVRQKQRNFFSRQPPVRLW
jgi:hypothetical protein